MPVTESIPNNAHTAHIKVSKINGASILEMVQNTITNTIIKNPNTPHTLLEDIPECEVIISLKYSLIFFI